MKQLEKLHWVTLDEIFQSINGQNGKSWGSTSSYCGDASLTLLGEESKESPLTCTVKPPCLSLHWEQPDNAEHLPVSKLTKVTSAILKINCLGAMIPLVSSPQDPELRPECPTTSELKIPARTWEWCCCVGMRKNALISLVTEVDMWQCGACMSVWKTSVPIP